MDTLERIETFVTTNRGVYILPGPPVSQARPRFGGGRAWNPQKQIKLSTQFILQNQHHQHPLFSGPLKVELAFHLPPAASMPQRQKDKMYQTPHVFKPDLDNMIKFVLDVANGILYNDDCTVASLIATKYYSHEPKTIITITRLENHETDK